MDKWKSVKTEGRVSTEPQQQQLQHKKHQQDQQPYVQRATTKPSKTPTDSSKSLSPGYSSTTSAPIHSSPPNTSCSPTPHTQTKDSTSPTRGQYEMTWKRFVICGTICGGFAQQLTLVGTNVEVGL
jgi:hypothetical protein